MTDMSPALKKAIEEFKENLNEAVEEGVEKIAAIQTRAKTLQDKMMEQQGKILEATSEFLDDAKKWTKLPEEIDSKIMAAFLYYSQVEPMAESHFQGDVFQKWEEYWNEIGLNDEQTVQAVQAELNKMQAGMIPLKQEQQQLFMEMQMSNPMPFPQNAPLVRSIAVPPETEGGNWKVAMIPFMVDEDFKVQTENLPFEYYVGAYVKGEGISDEFNMNAEIKRLSTAEPTVFELSGGDVKDDLLFIVGHVEQQGKPVGPIAMAPMPVGNHADTNVRQNPPAPQGGNSPRLLN